MRKQIMVWLLGALGSVAGVTESLPRPAFGPVDCAAALTGRRAGPLRRIVKLGLEDLVERTFVPVNYVEAAVRLEDFDPEFAAYRLGPDATDDELEAAREEAKSKFARAQKNELAAPLTETTPATALQAAALGFTQNFTERVDFLDARFYLTANHTLMLRTSSGGREVGEVELSLNEVILGYEGDITEWTFRRISDATESEVDVGPDSFVLEQGVAVLRPTALKSPFAFVAHIDELGGTSQDRVQIDVYTVRDCRPEVAESKLLQVPRPKATGGAAWCFTHTGLRLMTPEVLTPAPTSTRKPAAS